MKDTSRDPPDRQRGRLRPSREGAEQGVDDMFLPHKYGNKKVGDDGVSSPPGVRLMCRSGTDEDRHVGGEGYAEKSCVDREEQVAQVTNGLGVPLLFVLLFQITLPVESIFLGSDEPLVVVDGKDAVDCFSVTCPWTGRVSSLLLNRLEEREQWSGRRHTI